MGIIFYGHLIVNHNRQLCALNSHIITITDNFLNNKVQQMSEITSVDLLVGQKARIQF